MRDGRRSFVSTFFSVLILLRKYGVSHPLRQLIDKRSETHLDKCFADPMGHQTERIGDQVKLPFGDSWLSRMNHLICVVAFQCKVRIFNLIFLYYRRDYIVLGSEQDPTWRDFPTMLTEMGGARHYVTLYEAPFQTSQLSDGENNALRAGSLITIPPQPPGSQPLAGSAVADLLGYNLPQWASEVQEVASHMRWPPDAARSCPMSDPMSLLNCLEGLTRVPYCRICFGVGQRCQCTSVPRQAAGSMAALWALPTASYAAMVSSTETTASTSAAGVTPLSHLPPGMPALEPMDTSPAPASQDLLAAAGVGWGRKIRAQPQTPAASGLCQMGPRMPQQQTPTPGGRGAMPYQQQVFPPRSAASKSSATPSASQDPAGREEGARGRSSSQEAWDRQCRSQSSTRGSRKRR